jgi:hypothetical protein
MNAMGVVVGSEFHLNHRWHALFLGPGGFFLSLLRARSQTGGHRALQATPSAGRRFSERPMMAASLPRGGPHLFNLLEGKLNMGNLDNGRAAAALEIRKAFSQPRQLLGIKAPVDDPKRSTMTPDMDEDDERCGKDEDMSMSHAERKRLRRAKKAKRMLRDPSDSKQATEVIKVIHGNPGAYDFDMLTKASFEPGTVKNATPDRTELSKRWQGDAWNNATPEQRRALVAKWTGSDIPLSRFLKGPSQAVRPDPSLPNESDDTGPETQPRTLYGATNDWHDEDPSGGAPTPARMGGFTDSD